MEMLLFFKISQRKKKLYIFTVASYFEFYWFDLHPGGWLSLKNTVALVCERTYRPSDRHLAKLMPTIRIEVVTWSAHLIPTVVISVF
jgi:hypothetical protein